MTAIAEIVLRHADLPLIQPYKLSDRTFTAFDPMIAELRDSDGRVGWGEAIVSPGYTSESVEGAWAFLREQAGRLLGLAPAAARRQVLAAAVGHENAASVLVNALDMLLGEPLLKVAETARLPLLTPVSSSDPAAIRDEIDGHAAAGFPTVKVKVGFDVDEDLARVAAIQQAAAGRVTLRLDANRAYSRDQGCRFAAALDPAGIELFEQPCASADWGANAAVAAVSRVPVMLDESIYGLPDVERAATVKGVGFVKLKLKKLIGVPELKAGLDRIRALGLQPVLGDGVATEIVCWMEACVGRLAIANAGEMNGFLKPRSRLFSNPLPFDKGAVVVPAGYWPEMDRKALAAMTAREERFASSQVGGTAR